MSTLKGKVAFIAGAGRGQGRSHAIELAKRGVDIIAIDICADIPSIPYALATSDDLKQTVALVEAEGGRIVASVADVRDSQQVQRAVDAGVERFGRLDIVVANAGVVGVGATDRAGWEQEFRDVVETNLFGAWNSVLAAEPHLLAGRRGGSIVITSSTAGFKGIGGNSGGGEGYVASKHGVVGLMRNLASRLAAENIRVNTIHPTGVATPMVRNPAVETFLMQSVSGAGEVPNEMRNLLDVPMVESIDITKAVLYLVEDSGRFITGTTLVVDAGFLAR
ncbi:mycofactocin-coupled SDR family oxidoreductase [Mycolicibacterium neoaurum]|uniref:mycofactocin-coupled SDR family oxidoreductase n=1 Tax=Mycolicibacterium neoaurum TaxID=1795 RepID=UPI002672E956|nr:mycofactocin-coupled SDR family oxidoreductase [Mycolicibacterium neoaurum]MDO3402778.1 mycofactocin-coupled SDR family oxidoreductase [Mycolicibacterium neoaurum]